MFCKYCGAKLESDSIFCSACGAKLADAPAAASNTASTKRLTKTFDFGGWSFNEGNVREINEWLQGQSISICEISIVTSANHNIPFKFETVINHLEIGYNEVTNAPKYQLGYFQTMQLFGGSYKKVNAQLESWKERNSTKTVVWHRSSGHQSNSGSSQVVYFLYY